MTSNIKCTPCKSGDIPLSITESKGKLLGLEKWSIIENGKKLKKEYRFSNFVTTLEFVNKVGAIAENQGHHPDIYFTWGKCTIEIYTHKINGLHENDFILAREIEAIKL